MDSKGIEIQGVNLFIRPEPFDVNRDTSFIKPVESITQDMMGSVMQKKPYPAHTRSGFNSRHLNEDDAETATAFMNMILDDTPELEADWQLDKDNGIFVVLIKERESGRVIRQIPADEILAGIPSAEYEKGSALVDTTA